MPVQTSARCAASRLTSPIAPSHLTKGGTPVRASLVRSRSAYRLTATSAVAIVSLVAVVGLHPASAVVPGQNGRVVHDTFGDVYSVAPDGSDPRRSTTAAGSEGAPAWSSDGRRIAYTYAGPDGEPSSQIYVMNADGRGQTRLTDEPSDFHAGPAWSPDGKQLAFNRDEDLWVMEADGTAPRSLASVPVKVDSDNIAWSPDGATARPTAPAGRLPPGGPSHKQRGQSVIDGHDAVPRPAPMIT